MDPSERWWNHSGCSVTQGWSGEHWRAKSSAISIRRVRAVATKWSKSSIVPRSGCTASCPPSAEPMAQGTPGSSAPGERLLFGPLRWVVPMGWIGGR